MRVICILIISLAFSTSIINISAVIFSIVIIITIIILYHDQQQWNSIPSPLPLGMILTSHGCQGSVTGV